MPEDLTENGVVVKKYKLNPNEDLLLGQEHVHGNFHHYYEFNPAQERLQHVSPALCQSLRQAVRTKQRSSPEQQPVLNFCDVGCNEGDVTIGLHQLLSRQNQSLSSLSPPKDIVYDSMNLSRLNDWVQKQDRALHQEISSSESPFLFDCQLYIGQVFYGEGKGRSKRAARIIAATEALNRLSAAGIDTNGVVPESVMNDDLPLEIETPVLVHGYGIDIDPELISRAIHKNHAEIEFKCLDIMKDTEGRRQFDLVTCLSITMWIHLHHGDQGLFHFLDRVIQMTDHLLIEPQPWKCYRNAIRRMKRLKLPIPKAFDTLELRSNVQEAIERHLLKTNGFQHYKVLGETTWTRRLVLCSKTPIPGLEYDKRDIN